MSFQNFWYFLTNGKNFSYLIQNVVFPDMIVWKNEGGFFKVQMWKFYVSKILTGIFTSVMLSILHDCPADNECASYFLAFRGVSLRYARNTAYGSVEKVFRRVLTLVLFLWFVATLQTQRKPHGLRMGFDTPLIFFFKNRKKLHINIRKKI